MADVSAKDGSQETLVNLAALVCSLILVPLVTGKHMVIWSLFLLFTLLHLYANYSAVTSVIMDTINQARLHIIVQRFFLPGASLRPVHVNAQEPVLRTSKRKLRINLGASFGSVCKSLKDADVLARIYQDSDYLLDFNTDSGVIAVVLSAKATARTQLLSCFQAELINLVFQTPQHMEGVANLKSLLDEARTGSHQNLLKSSYLLTKSLFEELLSRLENQGWNTNIALLGAEEWRACWDFSGLGGKKET